MTGTPSDLTKETKLKPKKRDPKRKPEGGGRESKPQCRVAGSGGATSEPGKGRGRGLAVPRSETGGREALGGGAIIVMGSLSECGEAQRDFVGAGVILSRQWGGSVEVEHPAVYTTERAGGEDLGWVKHQSTVSLGKNTPERDRF